MRPKGGGQGKVVNPSQWERRVVNKVALSRGKILFSEGKRGTVRKKLKKIAIYCSLPTYLIQFLKLHISTAQDPLVHLKHWYLSTKLHVTSQHSHCCENLKNPTALHVDT
jgi:hypothetical protein